MVPGRAGAGRRASRAAGRCCDLERRGGSSSREPERGREATAREAVGESGRASE